MGRRNWTQNFLPDRCCYACASRAPLPAQPYTLPPPLLLLLSVSSFHHRQCRCHSAALVSRAVRAPRSLRWRIPAAAQALILGPQAPQRAWAAGVGRGTDGDRGLRCAWKFRESLAPTPQPLRRNARKRSPGPPYILENATGRLNTKKNCASMQWKRRKRKYEGIGGERGRERERESVCVCVCVCVCV